MWVKNIFLKCIQSYEYANIDLSKGINIIVGENNSGKSTIIKALFKLQGSHLMGRQNIRKGNENGSIGVLLGDQKIVPLVKQDFQNSNILPPPNDDRNLVLFNFTADSESAVFLSPEFNRIVSDAKFEHIRGFNKEGKAVDANKYSPFSSEEPRSKIIFESKSQLV